MSRQRALAPIRTTVFIALRQLWERKLLNGIAVGGVTLGVLVLIAMNGIMLGFEDKFTSAILKISPHVILFDTELRPQEPLLQRYARTLVAAHVAHESPTDRQARIKRPYENRPRPARRAGGPGGGAVDRGDGAARVRREDEVGRPARHRGGGAGRGDANPPVRHRGPPLGARHEERRHRARLRDRARSRAARGRHRPRVGAGGEGARSRGGGDLRGGGAAGRQDARVHAGSARRRRCWAGRTPSAASRCASTTRSRPSG